MCNIHVAIKINFYLITIRHENIKFFNQHKPQNFTQFVCEIGCIKQTVYNDELIHTFRSLYKIISVWFLFYWIFSFISLFCKKYQNSHVCLFHYIKTRSSTWKNVSVNIICERFYMIFCFFDVCTLVVWHEGAWKIMKRK